MKKHARLLVSLLLIAVLVSCLSCATAFAASGNVGAYLEVKLYDSGAWEWSISQSWIDTTPPGMQVEYRNYDTEIWLVGTPTKAGNYVCSGGVTLWNNGETRTDSYSVNVDSDSVSCADSDSDPVSHADARTAPGAPHAQQRHHPHRDRRGRHLRDDLRHGGLCGREPEQPQAPQINAARGRNGR